MNNCNCWIPELEKSLKDVTNFVYLCVLAFSLNSCAGRGGDETESSVENPSTSTSVGIDYATQVQPIFDSNCSCHLTFIAPQGVVLQAGASYDSLVNLPSVESPSLLLVKPGDPDNSYLVIKIDNNVPDVNSRRVGDRMPRGLPLKASEIEIIRQWIEEGAFRTSNTLDKEPPTFNGATLAVTLSATAINLFWDSAVDNETSLENIVYKVFLATESGTVNFSQVFLVAPRGSSTVRVGGLEPDTCYYFVVQAEDVAGNQDSNIVEVSAKTLVAPVPPSGDIDFLTQIQPIFDSNCSCHLLPSVPQGVILTAGLSYDFLVNVPSSGNPSLMQVKPGFPNESYLVVKIDDSVPGVSELRVDERMPFGLPPLRAEDIQLIRLWITQGARRTVSQTPGDTVPPEFAGVALAEAVSPTEITLSWSPAIDDETPPESILYFIFVATGSGGQVFTQPDFTAPPGSTGFEVRNLVPDTEYFFVVQAQDATGNRDVNRVEVSERTLPLSIPPTSVDFDSQVLPILHTHCTRCHGGFFTGECAGIVGLCFDSFEAIEETAFDGWNIIPFDSASSEVVRRIRGESLPRMPFDGPPFLTEAEIAIVETWIDTGARPSETSTENRPPIADPGGPYIVAIGTPLTLSGMGSFDPDGDTLIFEWDFGDDTMGSGEMPEHIYSSRGNFTIQLVVSDGELRSEATTTSVTVVREYIHVTDTVMEQICNQCHGARMVPMDETRGEILPPGEGMAFFVPSLFMDCNIRIAQTWQDIIFRMQNANGYFMTDAEEKRILIFLANNCGGRDPRAETFTRVCSGCHSTSILLSVPRSPGQWATTVNRMINRYEANILPDEQTDIIDYLSTVARGEPPEELPEAEGRIYMNLVCSSCHSPARALDVSTGLPETRFRTFGNAVDLTTRMTGRGCGLPGVTDLLIANWLSTVENPLPDILSIDRYEFDSDKGEIEVRAWSSASGEAVLTVTGEGGLEAIMENRGGGEYWLKLTGIQVFPGNITITSSLGGALKWHRKLGGICE